MTAPAVYMLTWNGDPKALYGSLLTFKTLRIGFPTAVVTVIDNCSHPGSRPYIKQAAEKAGCLFSQLENPISHHCFANHILMQSQHDRAVIIDPDVIFWENIEDWKLDKFVYGRLIPEFNCEYTNTRTMPRLHTSHVWFNDLPEIRKAITSVVVDGRKFEWNPSEPSMQMINGEWVRWDTLAPLYAAIPQICRPFTEDQLNSYDHLFCGSHLASVIPHIDDDGMLSSSHELAINDYRQLRGVWKEQQQYFERRSARKI